MAIRYLSLSYFNMIDFNVDKIHFTNLDIHIHLKGNSSFRSVNVLRYSFISFTQTLSAREILPWFRNKEKYNRIYRMV